MTNTRSTKSALISSVIALLLCFAMLVGSTFAWFTDSVTSANNIIKSGNLDIELDYWNGNAWETVEGTDSLFTNNLWEPGHTEVVYLKLSNLGSLALKYQLAISVLSETEGTNMAGDSFKLSDYIQMGVVEGINGENNSYADRATAVEAVKANSGIIGDGYAKQGNMLAGDPELYMAVVVYMPETVGNVANAKTGTPAPTINLGVQVLATQMTAESDGFDNQYDEGATFGTYIELEAGADLLAAMASAEADMPLTIKLNGDVEWPTEGHHGENDITPASSIVIDGNGYTITATGSGVTPLGDQTAPMTLKNVKIVDNSVSYNEGAWELTYLEMGGTRLTCENVTFADEIQTGTTATFTNCSFESNEESVYAVWVEGGSATFTNCTFTGYRGLKMHEDYGSEISSVVVKDCTFNNLTKKPGVAIGNIYMNGDMYTSGGTTHTNTTDTTVSITGSTFINCQAGDQGLYIYETDTDVTTFNFTEKNNAVYNNATVVTTKDELLALSAKALTSNNNVVEEAIIIIGADIDMAGAEFSAIIAQRGDKLTVVGNGHKISNVKVVSGANDNTTGMASMFYTYPNSTLTASNLTLENITVTADANASGYAAAVVGYCEGAAILNNIDVVNATITGVKSSGMLVGHLSGSLTATDCDLSGTVTLADFAEEANGHYAGKYIGTMAGATVLDKCTANVNVSGNLNAANLGEVYGRKTAAGSIVIDDISYATNLAELRAAIANGGEVKLVEDITVTTADMLYAAAGGHSDGSAFIIKKDTVIDLNGHDIAFESNSAWSDVFFMKSGNVLTIKGEGDIKANCSIACVYDANSTLNVEGGNFYVTADNDMLYAIYGKINVSGGTFTTSYWNTINIYGSGRVELVDVSGGSFENWNPASSPDGNLLADGYTVTSEVIDGVTWYTVVAA